MSRSPVLTLQAEIRTLEELLQELSAARFIERMGLESRLDQARKQLTALKAEPQPKALPITFRGGPVHGTRAIDANFASLALRGFVDAIDAVALTLTTEKQRPRGANQKAAERALQIVDTAVGSFGFELELPPLPLAAPKQTTLLPEPKPTDPFEKAIDTTLALIQEASGADEDAMSDLIAELDPKAVAKVRAFTKVLADYDAVFAAEFEGRQVRLETHADVARVMSALKDEDISERVETYRGQIFGILPTSRAFECTLVDGHFLKGKVDRSVEDLLAFKKQWELVDASLHFRVIAVRQKQRHILVGAEPSTPDAA